MTSEFVWHLEDVLDLYADAPDPARPVVCFDEYGLALTAPTREPIPAAPGRVRREDYEYERHGSAALLACFQPAAGWRRIQVCSQRTKQEFAEVMRQLVEEHFPQAEVIRVVLDNLNTHTLAAFYEAFPPEQARHLASKLVFHHTPKHGSWLNMVEIEWAILTRQCLDQHLPDLASVEQAVGAWVAERNRQRATVDWRFTTLDARRRLHRLYPRRPGTQPATVPATSAPTGLDLAADG